MAQSPDTAPLTPLVKFWCTANKLSLLRVAAIPLLIILMYDQTKTTNLLAALFFAFASLTDWIDGFWARHFNQVSPAGQILDPLADKLLVMSALIMLVRFDCVAGWLAILIIGREITITTVRGIAATEGVIMAASQMGKWKTTLQTSGIVGLLLGPDFRWLGVHWWVIGYALLLISTFFSLFSAMRYVQAYIRARDVLLKKTA